MSFESIYTSQLPRMPVTDAHRRLEQLREHLVAGQTQVPIYFDSAPVVATRNPYAAAYANHWKLSPCPADTHASATERFPQ